jgi:NADH:ubiquinone oxidoreductase subunit 5 (subunit L)/multisubunit Na+/H+ antiporter MnhA subunit
MVERRTATGELVLLGGMARGRPALATVLMTTGVIALAVPLSTAFAGEFLILAGVFQQGWGWAVVGAISIVLAAMYVLRLISAVLHEKVGPAVSEAALDLRPGELSVVVPLVGILIALSAWPDAISGHSFGAAPASAAVESALVEKPGGVNELASGTYSQGVGPPGCAAAASQFGTDHQNPAPGVYTVPCQGGGHLKITVKGSQSGSTTSTYAWSAA